MATYPGKVIIIGDLNIHVDTHASPGISDFMDVLSSHRLTQHVHESTHEKGHTLDIILTREEDELVSDVEIAPFIKSDHDSIHFIVDTGNRSCVGSVPKMTRDFRSLDDGSFANQLQDSLSNFHVSQSSVDDIWQTYHSAVTSTLNDHAPVVSRKRSVRRRCPWYTQEVHDLRRERRRAERRWRETGLQSNHLVFVNARDKVNEQIMHAKAQHLKKS